MNKTTEELERELKALQEKRKDKEYIAALHKKMRAEKKLIEIARREAGPQFFIKAQNKIKSITKHAIETGVHNAQKKKTKARSTIKKSKNPDMFGGVFS